MKAVGVDFGGTKILTALVNGKGKVLKSIKVSTNARAGRKKVIQRIKDTIYAVSQGEKIKGIGIGAPGPLNIKKGIVVQPPNLPGWNNVAIAKELKKTFKVPVFLENDANAMALAEHKFGAGKGTETMALITLGTGIGGAIIVNGKLFHGANGMAGEIGHAMVRKDNFKCNCGKVGCFEAEANSKSMILRAKKLGLKVNSTFKLEELALAGNKKAKKAVEQTAVALGWGLANIVNFLDPEVIVVGGGLSNIKMLYARAIKEMKKRVFKIPARNVKVVKAKLGNTAGAIGAALVVFERKR